MLKAGRPSTKFSLDDLHPYVNHLSLNTTKHQDTNFKIVNTKNFHSTGVYPKKKQGHNSDTSNYTHIHMVYIQTHNHERP